jgi:DNA polymerase alpha-associated DNA helicase A
MTIAHTQGSSGTGKTHTLIEIIRQLATVTPHNPKPLRLLVCGASNLSVDNILERLLALPPGEKGEKFRVTRIGHPARVMENEGVLESTLDMKAGRSEQVRGVISLSSISMYWSLGCPSEGCQERVGGNSRPAFRERERCQGQKATGSRKKKVVGRGQSPEKRVCKTSDLHPLDLLIPRIQISPTRGRSCEGNLRRLSGPSSFHIYSFWEFDLNLQIVLATCHTSGGRQLRTHDFDVVIIDEATQALEAVRSDPTLSRCCLTTRNRFRCAGYPYSKRRS